MREFKHPYIEFEQTKLWKLIEKSIDDLVENHDIELATRKEYIVGYMCKVLMPELKNAIES